jgi:Holliday junction resolvase RusA-like endonuclease
MLRLTPSEARKLGISVNKKTCRAKIKHRPEPKVTREPGKLTVIIYDVPPSLNDWHGMHWAAKAKVKRQWEELLIALLSGCRCVEKPEVRITYHYDLQRDRDKDNMAPKYIMDGLVKAGVIHDDNIRAVDLDWTISLKRAEWSRTEIVIQER